jgi:hypothetical protein
MGKSWDVGGSVAVAVAVWQCGSDSGCGSVWQWLWLWQGGKMEGIGGVLGELWAKVGMLWQGGSGNSDGGSVVVSVAVKNSICVFVCVSVGVSCDDNRTIPSAP